MFSLPPPRHISTLHNQLTADIGAAPILGEFKSRVTGIGPQAGYLFPVGVCKAISI
jgi:hypothetical protein